MVGADCITTRGVETGEGIEPARFPCPLVRVNFSGSILPDYIKHLGIFIRVQTKTKQNQYVLPLEVKNMDIQANFAKTRFGVLYATKIIAVARCADCEDSTHRKRHMSRVQIYAAESFKK